ncbi:Protein of unknown function [Gryllus bimaculatus]|nr:Protein of unknown function [Gryllus bimaculatus]
MNSRKSGSESIIKWIVNARAFAECGGRKGCVDFEVAQRWWLWSQVRAPHAGATVATGCDVEQVAFLSSAIHLDVQCLNVHFAIVKKLRSAEQPSG